MATVNTYLNFNRQTEAAFDFYRQAFGTDYAAPIRRFGDMPAMPGQPPLPEADRGLVLHVALPILGGHLLMGTDAPESVCPPVITGNNFHISLHPDTRAEADGLFAALSAGGKVTMPMQVMFWGDYFGSFVDRFGVGWMINCSQPG